MIMRIDWNEVPYFMITIKPVFGNLGKVVGDHRAESGQRVYRLHSFVDPTLYFNFYEHELILCKGD